MVNAVIEHQGVSAIIPLPCKRIIMAEQLASIGIMKPAHEIKCKDEEDEPIKVKIIGGESVFEWTFASLVSSEDTLSFVNSICEIFDNLPYQNKLDAMEIAMTDQVSSLKEFGNRMVESRMKDTIAKFYCPLVGTAYHRNEYGDLDEYGMAEMSPSEQITFKAALTAEKAHGATFDDILNISQNLHRYEMSANCINASQFFTEYLLTHMDTKFDAEWLNNAHFESEGRQLLSKLGASLTEYGVISAWGGSLYQLVPCYEQQSAEEAEDLETEDEIDEEVFEQTM